MTIALRAIRSLIEKVAVEAIARGYVTVADR
jgi:hypothetical protein